MSLRCSRSDFMATLPDTVSRKYTSISSTLQNKSSLKVSPVKLCAFMRMVWDGKINPQRQLPFAMLLHRVYAFHQLVENLPLGHYRSPPHCCYPPLYSRLSRNGWSQSASHYTVQTMWSFFSTWEKSRSLLAREALRAAARAAAKQST